MTEGIDKDGFIKFENVPVGVHKLSIPIFRDYLKTDAVVRMIEPVHTNEYHAFVEIAKSGIATTTVKLEFPKRWRDDETADGLAFMQKAKTQISIMAVLVTPNRDIDPMLDDEEVEWEEEFVYKPDFNHYQLHLAGGHYMIVITYPGLLPVQEHVVISPYEEGNTVLDYVLEEEEIKPIKVSVLDPNCKFIPGVLVTMRVKDSKKYVEGLTNSDGICDSLQVKWHNTYEFCCKKKGYLNSPVEVIFTKYNSESMSEIKLFMTQQMEEPANMDILVASPLLRPNADYIVHLFTCHSPDPDHPGKKEEAVVTSDK